ncbi:MAG: hypothetical protein RBT76_15130 [candidate division Zixibacteria bacterium]|jgi:hypothetical protein|nr:hypothetical protein [candidate division Zixibacteria bacterium]
MRRIFGLGSAVAAAVVIVSGIISADEQATRAPLQQVMPEQYETYGLYKLNDVEQEQLIESFALAPVPSFMDGSAARYLEKQGYRPIRIIGAVVVNEVFEERLLLAVHDYELVTLDPIGEPFMLEPGRYWAKTTGTSWEIIYPDGSEVTHWMRELR